MTYALEAETTDGWCLPEAQLAISGIMVARTVYDTLTAPNAAGEYVPYLAKSVTPNDSYDEWTITLRDGIKFHDGTDLTAEVVKNNLDAYRGSYDNRPNVLLFRFVLANIDTVEVTGDMEVTVTTKVPWVAFPAFLHGSGRIGILAQAQLDNEDACDTELIGTGPFKLESWEVNQEFVAVKNPNYWQDAPDGQPYPYLDEIRFRPIIEPEQRVNAMESGNIDLLHASGAPEFLTLRDLKENGQANTYESAENAEVTFLQMNTSEPPLDDIRVRQALALSIDREDYRQVINQGLFQQATGPFAPGSIGYLEETGFPKEGDIEEATRLVEEYEAENGPIELTYQATPGTQTQQIAQYVQQAFGNIGMDINLTTIEQAELISNAIAGDFQIQGFRNYPGGDPDELYVWWSTGSPANFARIDDPEIQRLLDEGRSEPDPDARKQIYQDLNRRFGEQVWSLWANWTEWIVGSRPEVHGFSAEEQPKLPDGSAPFKGLPTGHPVQGIWVEQ
ncbi:MAG TPA: ABC transporter substrate-binding protein [Acidimicrobiales bacterium]|nr:ABC transporter substrate-binding protein [Acidimicrobiales bacterium]